MQSGFELYRTLVQQETWDDDGPNDCWLISRRCRFPNRTEQACSCCGITLGRLHLLSSEPVKITCDSYSGCADRRFHLPRVPNPGDVPDQGSSSTTRIGGFNDLLDFGGSQDLRYVLFLIGAVITMFGSKFPDVHFGDKNITLTSHSESSL